MMKKRWIVIGACFCIVIIVPVSIIFFTLQFTPGPCGCVPIGSLVASPFSNPSGNVTKNGGGWKITVESISGKKIKWADANVILRRNYTKLISMDGIKPSSADIFEKNNTKKEAPNWFLRKDLNVSVNRVMFSDGVQPTARTLSNTPSALSENGLETVQGASFIVVDQRDKGYLDIGDSAYVFNDTDADGGSEIFGFCTLDIAIGGSTLASAALY